LLYLVGRGRTAALLAGAGSKKRKIGPNTYESQNEFYKGEVEKLTKEVADLRQNLIDSNTRIQIQDRMHNSETQPIHFNI
jgi:hypothetical protein